MPRGVGGHGPANIMRHLKGIHFPASKTTIIDVAQNGPGPDTIEVVAVLSIITDKSYDSPAEIMRAVSKKKWNQLENPADIVINYINKETVKKIAPVSVGMCGYFCLKSPISSWMYPKDITINPPMTLNDGK